MRKLWYFSKEMWIRQASALLKIAIEAVKFTWNFLLGNISYLPCSGELLTRFGANQTFPGSWTQLTLGQRLLIWFRFGLCRFDSLLLFINALHMVPLLQSALPPPPPSPPQEKTVHCTIWVRAVQPSPPSQPDLSEVAYTLGLFFLESKDITVQPS